MVNRKTYSREYYLTRIKTDPIKVAKRRESDRRYFAKARHTEAYKIKQRERMRKWRKKNIEKCRETGRKWQKRYRAEMGIFLKKYLKKHPCVDCGEKNIIVLEFDHTRDKKFSLSHAGSMHISRKNVLEEITKCEIRCANCHRIKTYKEQRQKLSTI